MPTYKITLRPLSTFFFGGEQTFGEGANANYYAKSNYMPQQTALLGMLRFEVLKQQHLLSAPHSKWSDYIGDASFIGSAGTFSTSFGAISNLSPVFLTNGTEHYIPQAFDWSLNKDNVLTPIEVDLSPAPKSVYTDSIKSVIPNLRVDEKAYDPKKEIQKMWVESKGEKMRQYDFDENFKPGRGFENGLFVKYSRVGIHRQTDKPKGKEDGDFYKQDFYQLAERFCFAFFVDLDLPLQSGIVHLGAERSVFQMQVEGTQNMPGKSFDQVFTAQTFQAHKLRKHTSIILLGDTYADTNMFAYCHYAICESESFRPLQTTPATGANYNQFGKNVLTKGRQLFLLKRGSVLFPAADGTEKLHEALNHLAFKNIGYNHFLTLTVK